MNQDFNVKEYITLYDFAEMLGRNLETLLTKEISRVRFMQYIDNLPKEMIRKIELPEPVLINEKYPPVTVIYNLESIEDFLSNHIRMNESLNLIDETYGKLLYWVKKCNIPVYRLGKKLEFNFYSRKEFEQLIKFAKLRVKKIRNSEETNSKIKQYISIYELAQEKLGKSLTAPEVIDSIRDSIDKFPPGMINRKKLDYNDPFTGRLVKEVYMREEVERFFSNHINKKHFIKELKVYFGKQNILYFYEKLNITEFTVGNKTNIFISKHDAERLKLLCKAFSEKGKAEAAKIYGSFFGNITLDEAGEILKLGSINIKNLINSGEMVVVCTVDKTKLVSKEAVMNLFTEQMNLLEKFKGKYYTFSQVKEKYGDSFANYIIGSEDKIRRPVTKINIPTLLLGHMNYQARKVYEKEEIDSLWLDYKFYWQLNSVSFEDPFEDFIYKIEEVLEFTYKSSQMTTKDFWYQYVQSFLYKTKMSKQRIAFQVNQFVRNTRLIFGIFEFEIYSYSASDINQKFLNSNNDINRSYQRDFYSFLKYIINSFVVNSLPLPFNIEDINDPRTYNNIKEVDVGMYSLEEYHKLYEYANQVEFHKKKAITDVKKMLSTMNRNKYKKYDSCWAYILIQLTNNWRHSTIMTQVPRIELSNTKIESLDWLMENDISLEDANSIIFQIGRFVTKINKTRVSAEGIFNIGEPLKIAFATAISICEFRVRATCEDSLTLIDLASCLDPEFNPHKEFFKEFTVGFKFENRKMNKTLSTLIWSVLRHMGRGLKESQLSRSHMQERTTMNHYIKLTEEQIQKLVLELFERSQFGFVTQYLTNILFGEETNKSIETERMVQINKSFGDITKIEATAGVINRLASEREKVRSYLQQFNLQELQKLYYQALSGGLPERQKHYQCIYTKCKFENEFGEKPPCETCAASIINVYALVNIMDNYIFLMNKIHNEFDVSIVGEKQKLANHFYLMHGVVNQARIKFGREVVDSFVAGGTERIKALGSQLSSKRLKEFKTSGMNI
ncbi:DNA-binding protein [Bacillus mycoides]|uniref:DNA-binding protein n=1 Tax=Bacillus mycoides TaxID=1405 RepID=UPI003D1BB80A